MYKNKNIIVIGTGGTIAGVGQKGLTGDYTSAKIKVETLVEEITHLDSMDNVKSVNMFDVDSCDITFDNLLEIAKYINKASTDESIQGFVITQGTDTLEESAYFLNLTVKTDKPVVITGSMRPNTALSADGPLNLYQSIALARSKEAKGKGVLTVFCDGIYSARDVRKVNTFRADAFNQRDLGCLGYMRDDKVYFYNNSLKLHTLNTEFEVSSISKLPKVDIIMFYMDASADILDFAANHAEGLVLAGAGCGNASTKWDKKITKLLEKNYPIVRSSRIGNGLITFNDELFTTGIGSNNLTPEKSRILLSLALSKTKNLSEIQEFFNVY